MRPRSVKSLLVHLDDMIQEVSDMSASSSAHTSCTSSSISTTSFAKEPRVELDYTLNELYQRSSSKGNTPSTTGYKSKNIVRVLTSSKSNPSVSEDTRCTKFVYQSIRPNHEENNSHAPRLGLLSQARALIAGRMPLFAFDASHILDDYEKDFKRALSLLEYRIRPGDISFCNGFLDLPIVGAGRVDTVEDLTDPCCGCDSGQYFPEPELITSDYAMDGLSSFKHLVKQDVLYDLQSKRSLVLSEIKTPRAHVIDFYPRLYPTTEEEIRGQTEKVITYIEGRDLPFKVQFQHGDEELIVEDEVSRRAAMSSLQTALPKLLESVNNQNNHLHPASTIVSEIPRNKNVEHATIFVHEDGTYTFTGTCTGSSPPSPFINFSSHDNDAKRLASTLSSVSRFLHSKSYTGPATISIVEDGKPAGERLVTNLLVGISDSMVLTLLKGYLYEERGFRRATYYPCIKVGNMSRDEFIDRFSDDVWNGRITVVGWVTEKGDVAGKPGWAGIVIAGQSMGGIERIYRKVVEASKFHMGNIKSLC